MQKRVDGPTLPNAGYLTILANKTETAITLVWRELMAIAWTCATSTYREHSDPSRYREWQRWGGEIDGKREPCRGTGQAGRQGWPARRSCLRPQHTYDARCT